MALTQAEKSDWLNKITEQVELLRKRLLSCEPGLLQRLEREATVEAHTRLGVAPILQQLKDLKCEWAAHHEKHVEECEQISARCQWMSDAIDTLSASLRATMEKEREKKRELEDARDKSREVLRNNGNALYASLDELLAVESSEGHYYADGSFTLRSAQTRELGSYAAAVAAELTHKHPLGRLSTVLDSATFEFSSAMRMVTTTKQAHIVWEDVQQFLSEFEEQLDESSQTEASPAGEGTVSEDSRAGVTAHG
jgi:hypothetical protein